MATLLGRTYFRDLPGYKFPEYITLYGDVSRSGNTINLTNLSATVEVTGVASMYGFYERVSIHESNSPSARVLSASGEWEMYKEADSTYTYSRTVSIGNASVSVGTTDTSKEFGVGIYDGARNVEMTKGFTVTFPSGSTPPTISNVSITGRTWNSITANTTVSSWGAGGSSGNYYRTLKILTTQYVQGATALGKKSTSTSTSAVGMTVGNNSHDDDIGTMTVKGAGKYYYGLYATNGAADTRWASSGTVSLPPAPLASLTYTQAVDNTSTNKVTHTIKIKGADSNSNNSNNVTTSYRYSTNGGSSWSSWTDISGAATPWTEKSATFTSGLGASIKVQARQVYDGQYSEVKEVSYTAATATNPTVGTPSVTARTWNSVTIKGKVTSWGTPSAVDGRALALGVTSASGSLSTDRREWVQKNVTVNTDYTGTVTNSSTASGGTGMTLKGCKTVYLYAYATNGVKNATAYNTTAVYLPPAPLQTLSVTGQTYVSETQTKMALKITGGSSTNNESKTVETFYRYKDSSTGTWTAWTSAGTGTPWTDQTAEITITAGKNIYLEAKQTYQGQDSEATSVTVMAYKRPAVSSVKYNTSGASSVSFTGSVSTWGQVETTKNYRWTLYDAANSSVVQSETTTTAANKTFTGLADNTKYTVRLKASNANWTSTSYKSAVAYTLPTAPTVAVVKQEINQSTGKITLSGSWLQTGLENSDADIWYDSLEYSIDGGSTWTTISLDKETYLNKATGSFTISELPAGTNVTIRTRSHQQWTDSNGNKVDNYSAYGTYTIKTPGYPSDTLSVNFSYDELRRQRLTYTITDEYWKDADTHLEFNLTGPSISLPSGRRVANDTWSWTGFILAGSTSAWWYVPLGGDNPTSSTICLVPNKTYTWTVTETVDDEVVATAKGSFVSERPILGVCISPSGSKTYITDIVKSGGSDSSDDFLYDRGYAKFVKK